MTDEMRKFRTTVIVLLTIVLLWTAFLSIALFYHSETEKIRRESENFGIYVCGTSVQYKNAADVLGDGTVSYDPGGNMLMLSNATLEYDGAAVIFAEKDLTIVLDGDNKLICTGEGSVAGLYASDYMLRKDISFIGGGTLTVEKGGNADTVVAGIVAKDIWAYSNITVDLTGVAEGSAGIECGQLCLLGENTVSVKVESTGAANGIFASGNVTLMDNTTLDVTNISAGENRIGMECTGSFMACKGSAINATAGDDGFGLLCHSVFFDYGATVNCEIDAVGGLRHVTE